MSSYIPSESLQRVEQLVGTETLQRILATKVILFGVGGVGSWCAETLVRSGISQLTIVDDDIVVPSNLNRQLMATTLTIGQPKVQALRDRLLDINPQAEITALNQRLTPDTIAQFNLGEYDFVIDAIDSLPDKAALILYADALPHTTLLSSMGAARRLDPTHIKIAQFRKVNTDPLARALRQRFKQLSQFPQGRFLCVYSDEQPGNTPLKGSVAHITTIFGNMLAALVIGTQQPVFAQ